MNLAVTKLLANDVLDPETQMHYNFQSQLNLTYGMHFHDFFEIFLIISGNAVHNVNGITQLLYEGSMVLVRPEDVHSYEKFEKDECQFINLAFSKETLNDLFIYFGESFPHEKLISSVLPPIVLLPVHDKSIVRNKLESLTLIPQTKKNHIRTHLRMLLADFMQNYFSSYSNDKKTIPLWLEQLVNEMTKKENFREGLPIMQKLSNRSYAYVSRTLKKYLDKTPTDFINELRLNFAENMLIHSDMSILDITLEAGFNNLSHFYHLFNKQYHLSPNKYRKMKQKFGLLI